MERSAAGAASESQFVTQEYLRELEGEMLEAAEQLQFERAAQLRDRIHELKKKMGEPVPEEESADVPVLPAVAVAVGVAERGRAARGRAARVPGISRGRASGQIRCATSAGPLESSRFPRKLVLRPDLAIAAGESE